MRHAAPAPQHYPTLLRQVSALVLTDDRAAITTALRILVRLSGTLDNDYAMASLDLAVLARLIPLVLLDDEQFVHAVLEFLSRYTAIGPETAARVGMAGQPGVVSTLIAIMASGYRGTFFRTEGTRVHAARSADFLFWFGKQNRMATATCTAIAARREDVQLHRGCGFVHVVRGWRCSTSSSENSSSDR